MLGLELPNNSSCQMESAIWCV
uniref:Uncharacterized protein n=1 Tax=Rhizophora mucronata TaxID=61149 RepID=A0A2P2NVS2_RHIMU